MPVLARPATLLPAALLLGGAGWLGAAHGWRQGALLLLGAALGAVLLRSAFSFAGGFRRLLAERRGIALRAQAVMLGLAALLFLPALEMGAVLGQPVRGFVFPVGIGLLLGSFLFGIGMQLGGGCASGTLYTAGGGTAPRMWITLAAFVAGATLAAFDAPRWTAWPALPAVSLRETMGAAAAVGLTIGLLGALWLAATAAERRRHGTVEPLRRSPLLWGAAALAALNLATLILAGRPWAITAGFPLWGSRVVETLGWDDPAFWPYWEDPTRTEALLRPLLADRTTVMDLGLVLGAALAAALAGRARSWRLPGLRPVAASLLGGLLLGYGAVIAFGCNISAFFGGIASFSLHGWVWIVPALLGNWVGLKLRPAFRL